MRDGEIRGGESDRRWQAPPKGPHGMDDGSVLGTDAGLQGGLMHVSTDHQLGHHQSVKSLRPGEPPPTRSGHATAILTQEGSCSQNFGVGRLLESAALAAPRYGINRRDWQDTGAVAVPMLVPDQHHTPEMMVS